MMKIFRWCAGFVLGMTAIAITAKAVGLSLFMIVVADFPGGTIDVSGKSYQVEKGNNLKIIPIILDRDTEVTLSCKEDSDHAGYATPGMDTLVFVWTEGCKIKSYNGYG